MKKRLKNPKEAAEYRNSLLKEQNGIDPILGIKITKPVLDHFHGSDQHCREVLQNEVNGWEGRVVNSFKRCLGHLTDKPIHEVLRSLADYLEKHENTPPEDMVIHHTALSIDVRKFKNFPAKKQIDILINLGVEPASNSELRSKQIRKFIKDGIFNINEHKN